MRPIQWGNVCYYGTTAIVANGSSVNAILGLKFRSINAILTTVRAVSQINTASKFGIKRIPLNDGATTCTYQYRIGSKLYPQAPISVDTTDASQAFQETMKAFSAVGNAQVSGSLTRKNFTVLPDELDTRPGPVYAIDLANFSQDVSVRESGLDTSSNGLMVEFIANGVGSSTGVQNGSKQLDAYAQYDCVWTLDGMGNLTAQA